MFEKLKLRHCMAKRLDLVFKEIDNTILTQNGLIDRSKWAIEQLEKGGWDGYDGEVCQRYLDYARVCNTEYEYLEGRGKRLRAERDELMLKLYGSKPESQ